MQIEIGNRADNLDADLKALIELGKYAYDEAEWSEDYVKIPNPTKVLELLGKVDGCDYLKIYKH